MGTLTIIKWINCNFIIIPLIQVKKKFNINTILVFVTKRSCRWVKSIVVNGLKQSLVLPFLSHTWCISRKSVISFCFCFDLASFRLSYIFQTLRLMKIGWGGGYPILKYGRKNWRVRWKKGIRYFTQNRTLSKTLQISHAVLFRCLKQCFACFFPEACFLFDTLRMRKNTFFRGHPLGTFCWMKNKRNLLFH